MKKTLLAILTLAMTLGLTLTVALPVYAGSARGVLIPGEAYVSGMGRYSFDTQSDNTVIVNLNIKKLDPNTKYAVYVSWEDSLTGGGKLVVGYPIADKDGNLSYTGFIYYDSGTPGDTDSGYPYGFPTNDSTDFTVLVYDYSTLTLDQLGNPEEGSLLKSDTVTPSMN